MKNLVYNPALYNNSGATEIKGKTHVGFFFEKKKKKKLGKEIKKKKTNESPAEKENTTGKKPPQNGKQNTVELLSSTKKYSPLYFASKVCGLCEAF